MTPFRFRSAAVLVASVALQLAAASAPAQVVPGFNVETYASSVTGPVYLSFAPDGTLYCGRDPSPTGSGTPQLLTRIGIGGAPVTTWGTAPTLDPDPVVFDVEGMVSGVPGSVLTGGIKIFPNTGSISAVRPDQGVVELWVSTQWTNPSEMKFDHLGRLIFVDQASRALWVSNAGEPPSLLTQFPVGIQPSHLAIAPDNRLFVADLDGRIHIVDEGGTVLQSPFATLPARSSIEFGVGAGFGTDLYALTVPGGTLYRVAGNGSFAQVGTGFTGFPVDLAFGPDGRLYLSHLSGGRVSVLSAEDLIFQHGFEP
jgi:hypothetical protein